MKILVVDDDPVILKAIEVRLLKENNEVDTTVDAKQAMVLLETNQYDLVISDIIMPYISGIELLTRIKRHNKKTIIFLISALDQKELILTSFEIGAHDFIIKPINLDELVIRIKKYFPEKKS